MICITFCLFEVIASTLYGTNLSAYDPTFTLSSHLKHVESYTNIKTAYDKQITLKSKSKISEKVKSS